jgi:hypothetical protein
MKFLSRIEKQEIDLLENLQHVKQKINESIYKLTRTNEWEIQRKSICRFLTKNERNIISKSEMLFF